MIRLLLIFFSTSIVMTNICYADFKKINSNLIVNQVNEISKNIRCLVCRNETIESSNSEFANDIRRMIKAKLLKGKSEEYIFKYLKSRYGDYILFKAPLQINTLILWILPFLCLLFGITIFTIKHIKLRKK